MIEGMPPKIINKGGISFVEKGKSGNLIPICGVQRREMPDGFKCTKPAGEGTDHLGIGCCMRHDSKKKKVKAYQVLRQHLKFLSDEECSPHALEKVMERAESLEETDLTSQDLSLRILHSLLFKYLEDHGKGEEGEKEWLFQDTVRVIEITEAVRRTQETNAKTRKILYFSPEAVKDFVRSLFETALEFVDKQKQDAFVEALSKHPIFIGNKVDVSSIKGHKIEDVEFQDVEEDGDINESRS